MDQWQQLIVTVITSFIMSSGFWAFMNSRAVTKDYRNDILMGLAHDRIVCLGLSYIRKKSITKDEYENLFDYLYEPYEKMGGNGFAKKVINEVNKLKIQQDNVLGEDGYDGFTNCSDK